MRPKKSTDIYIKLPDGMTRKAMLQLVDRAAVATGLYVSHIGSYSRRKYPGSVHWHFKRDKNEVGLIDATYWDVRSLFWLMIRHREPAWVHVYAPKLRRALQKEIAMLKRP